MNWRKSKMERRNNSAAGGISFSGLLQIVFIVLKLCHVIDWSWWCVLLPTLIPCVILLVIIAIALVINHN